MGRFPGYKGKVGLSNTKVAYVKSWNVSGSGREILDGTALGDEWESLEYGIGKGGTVALEGYFDPTDSTGQAVFESAYQNETAIDDIRLWYGTEDDEFLYCADENTQVLVEAFETKADPSGLVNFTMTLRVSEGTLKHPDAVRTADDIDFTSGSPATIGINTGSFVTDGFTDAMTICIQGSDSNDGYYTITDIGVAAQLITLAGGETLVNESNTEDVSIIGKL